MFNKLEKLIDLDTIFNAGSIKPIDDKIDIEKLRNDLNNSNYAVTVKRNNLANEYKKYLTAMLKMQSGYLKCFHLSILTTIKVILIVSRYMNSFVSKGNCLTIVSKFCHHSFSRSKMTKTI